MNYYDKCVFIYIIGDWFTGGVQSVDTQNLLDSVIITNKTIIRRIRVPTYEVYKTYWRDGEILLVRIMINGSFVLTVLA